MFLQQMHLMPWLMDSIDSSRICKEECEAWCCKNRAIVYTKEGKGNTCADYTCPLLAYFNRKGIK